ncbi:hypothetical protein D9M73_189720 [compost metagenome]
MISLKSSTSSNRNASGVPAILLLVKACSALSKKYRRLLLWVSTSVVARRCSSFSMCFLSVMSSAMPTISNGKPASVCRPTKHLSLNQRTSPSLRMMRYSLRSMAPISRACSSELSAYSRSSG